MDPEQQTQNIEFVNTGVNIRVDPKRIPPGGFQFIQNVTSELEGSLTPRRGRKKVGTEPGGLPHTYYKFVVADTEVPGTPSTNFRYIGDQGEIYRTQNFASFTDVAGDGYGNAAAVCTTPSTSTVSPLWSAVTYNAGTTGTPIEFFATQNYMLKDTSSIASPLGAHGLLKWGILPAYGVPTTATVSIVTATNANPIVVTTAIPHLQTTGDQVVIAGSTGNTAANGTWTITVTSPTAFSLTGSTGNGSYTGGGLVQNVEASNPNGGGAGGPAGSLPYQYVYTYANSKTLNEGNPSQEMLLNSAVTGGAPIATYANYIQVSGIYGTDDPQVDTIYLYRAGGTLTDGIFRRIQQFSNPGLGNTVSAYNDHSTDVAIVNATQLSFENYPPVQSTALSPLISTINTGVAPNTGTGRQTFNVNTPIFSTGPTVYGATRGSTMHIIGGEDVYIEQVISTTSAIVYFQVAYASGTTVEVDTITNQPCTLVCQAHDSIFIAGDPNNPQILYKSITGMPESWPVEDASGDVLQINVSNPGNPIVAICEFRGNILCMCNQSLYEVPVFNGVMLPPNVTPALRGLVAMNAWCKVDNEVWYLGYDGLWSWDGSQSIKKSDAIDIFFHNFRATLGAVSETAPLNYSPAWVQYVRMTYYHGQVHFVYNDVDGNNFEFVYDTIANRWSNNDKSNGQTDAMRVLYTEQDTGNLIYIRDGGVCCIDDSEDTNNNTTDEYTTSPTSSGTAITGEAITGWMDCGDQFINKVFDEFMIDYDPAGRSATNSIVVTVYVDYVWTAVDTFSIPANATSQRQWFSLVPNQSGGTGWNREAKVVAFAFVFIGGPLRPTLYGMKLRWRSVGQITEGPVYDWNNLGYPWDKRLQNFTIEFDTRSTQRTLIMDTISGVNGNNVSTGVQSFTFSNGVQTGPSRGLVVLPIPDGTIAKLVQLRADNSTATAAAAGSSFFRLLNVDFQYTKFPPDITLFTEPNDFGYPCEKVARNLIMKIDTGGVGCTVGLIADAVTVESFMVSTVLNDWERILPCNTKPDIIGRLYNLVFTPGTGGKAQLFDWSLDFVKEPCQVASIDTFETNMGFNGWKYLYQGWFDYFSSSALNLSIFKDSGILFFSTTLPAHNAARDVERIYFPIATTGAFNKSKVYRTKIQGSSAFKLYSDTRLEWLPWNGDQRANWQQFTVSPENQLPVG